MVLVFECSRNSS